jgi:phosphatidylglycerol:prolipoprotein diacylglycerol transferase
MPLARPIAVIPWFLLPSLSLGPFTIQSFGVLSAIGILVAVQLSAKAAGELGGKPQLVLDASVWGVLAGIVGGHLVHLFFYHPEELAEPVRILKVWEGLSSMGGLLGGILATWAYFRSKGTRLADYTDGYALGMPVGWAIARVGCFTVHDHPGVRTDFPLAVAFPGGPRHDLGLYEAIVLLAIGAVVWALHRRGLLRGRLIAVVALLYGTARFLLDFLRTREVVTGPGYYASPDGRQLGLTFAQWFSIALVAWAVWVLAIRRARGTDRA